MADRTRTTRKISDEVLDELLAGEDAAEVFRSGTLIDDLKKAVAERALDAEMEMHLEREGEEDAGNHRNGHNRKPVLTDSGAMDRRCRGTGSGGSSRSSSGSTRGCRASTTR